MDEKMIEEKYITGRMENDSIVGIGLNKAQSEVEDFTRKAGQEIPLRPVMPSMEVRKLRVRLIAEELMELCEAYALELLIGSNSIVIIEALDKHPDSVLAYDATLDILYVTVGNGVAMGTNLETGWNEVQRSNMSKFIDGHRREDGKWIKGPSYSPANLKAILDAQ